MSAITWYDDIGTLRLTAQDWNELMVCLGVAAARGGEDIMQKSLRLQELLNDDGEEEGARQ